jgi:hypothetical protein
MAPSSAADPLPSSLRAAVAGADRGSWPRASLNKTHLGLTRAHGLTDDVVAAAGLRSFDAREELAPLPGRVSQTSPLPALGIPIAKLGLPIVRSWLLRPDDPRRDKRGKIVKYENVRGRGWRPFYILPRDADRALSSNTELWITEGVFDALALASTGCVALGLTAGVFGWSSGGRPHDDWGKVSLLGRSVKIAFDADQVENPLVRDAATRLADFLSSQGALPTNIEMPGGDVSDYVAKGGDPESLAGYPRVDEQPFLTARNIIDAVYAGVRHRLAVALLDDMRKHGLKRSSRTMNRLGRMAGVSKKSAERFGREVASGELPPFAVDGWQSWDSGWTSRILILDLASLAEWKQRGCSHDCARCEERLPAGSRSTRKYCSDRCRKAASRERAARPVS